VVLNAVFRWAKDSIVLPDLAISAGQCAGSSQEFAAA